MWLKGWFLKGRNVIEFVYLDEGCFLNSYLGFGDDGVLRKI